jgi:predicted NBD/HSP70 family sugar kinase
MAVADVNGRILAQDRMQTPADPAVAVRRLGERLRRLIELNPEMTFAGVGVSVPGRVDPTTERVLFAPNLKWEECDIRGPLEQATGMRVELENAANACALAEVWFGDSDGWRDMVVVTVSEGIGAGLFTGGRVVRGLNGMAGEFGHVQFDPEGPECACGKRGCWELYASTRAAMRYYSESRAESSGPTFLDLLRLAETGDSLAIKALEKMARAIGRGLRMIVAAMSPEEIVIVGELTRQWERFEPVLAQEVAAATLAGKPARVRPVAVDPSLARLRGALAVVLHSQFAPSSRTPEEASPADQDGVSVVLGEVLTPAI